MMERVSLVEAGRAVIGRQVAGQWPIEAQGALLDHLEGGGGRDHLRDRGHLESGLDGDGHTVPAVGQTSGVLEYRFAPSAD